MASIFKEKITMGNLFKFALPSILMQLVLSLYTIVDGIFVSRFVGTTALSAINIVMPVVSLLIAVCIMFATGGAAIVGKELGEKRDKKARRTFSLITATTLVAIITIAVLSLIFLPQIVRVLGASEAILPYGIDYLRILLFFSPALASQALFQIFFITEGKPRLGLVSIIAAGITNVILDYLFIVVFNIGIGGAALATGIGYMIPTVIGFVYFARSRRNLYFVRPQFNIKTLLNASGNGSSEMVTNLSSALVTFLINILFMKYYGESGVAAVTIILYFEYIFLAIYLGFSLGIAPVVSYKYGEENTKDLKRIFKNSLKILAMIAAGVLVISTLSINSLLSFFTTDEAVKSIALDGFPFFVGSLALMSINIFASTFFTALSNGTVSAIISFLRSFIFLSGSFLLLPLAFGKLGLWSATTMAESLALIVSIGFFITKRKKYKY